MNLSSSILFKVAIKKSEKHSYSKISWALPINKYDLITFFRSPFFIKLLVSIFKMIIYFMLRNYINPFFNYKYISNIFKNEFLVLCIVFTNLTNATNISDIFLIFYDYLNFCYFTLFGSVKFTVENFTANTFYF